MNRYHLLLLTTFFTTFLISYTQSADRSPTSLLFNTLFLALPIGAFLLFIDYALTVIHKHNLMKYYYLAFFLFVLSYHPIMNSSAATQILRPFIGAPFIIATIGIMIVFFINAAHTHEEEEQKHVDHPMHVIADTYQKHKESKEPWEAQMYDFFAEKIKNYTQKKNWGKNSRN